jgi:hypothetical protein
MRERSPFPAPTDLTNASSAPSTVRLRVVPVVYVFSDLILGDAVALLNLALELIPFTVDGGEIIVGKVSPFLFDIALHLLLISLDAIPVHFRLFACFATNGAWLESFRGAARVAVSRDAGRTVLLQVGK